MEQRGEMMSHETQSRRTGGALGKKLSNWWYYSRRYVLGGALVLVVLAYIGLTDHSAEDPDYSVLYVSAGEPSETLAEGATSQLESRGKDLNGDGEVVVALHRCIVDLQAVMNGTSQNPQKDQGNLLSLEMDLSVCQSGIVITDAPEILQRHSGLMLYLDGTFPEEGASDWENMFLPWTDILEPVPAEAPLYIGMRGWWTEDQALELQEDLRLWQALLNQS